ncbi:MAG: DHA2 family efflux MFS transporter permease subunit [bacterium]
MSAPAATAVPAKPWLKWIIAITAALGAVLEVLDTSIVNVALSDMQSTLGATLSEIGWVVTGYAIANVIIIPLSAWLGDYFGKKRYFIFSMIAFVLASVLCGMSTTLPMLIAARVFQGLAGGGLLAKAQAILFENFPREEQGKAQAIFGIGVIVGPTLGPTLGGYLTTTFSWPWIFYVNVPFGILAVVMSILFLPEDSKIRKISSKIDWWGIILLVVSLGSLQWLLEEGQSEDWFQSPLIIRLTFMAVVGMGLFIWRELKTKHPAVNLRVLKHRSLAAGSIFSAVLGMGLYGAIFAIPIFCQQQLGFTPMQTGMILLPGALAAAFLMPLAGSLSNRFDPRLLVATGAILTAVSMFNLQEISPLTNTDTLFFPLILRSVGTVMMFIPLTLATFGPIPKQDIADASGFYSLTRQLGGSIGIAVLTTMLAQRVDFHRSTLVESLSQFSQATSQRLSQLQGALMAQGMDANTAKNQALAIIDRAVMAQASVISFGDIFHFVGFAFILSLPLLFLLGKKSSGPPADVH